MSKSIAKNRNAYRNFAIDDKYECGISLLGSEVKSIKANRININNSYVRIVNNNMLLLNAHISPLPSSINFDPTRSRNLLMHKYQIIKIKQQLDTKGYTAVPINVYIKKSLIKIEIGIGKGKTIYDKRQTIIERDRKREASRELKRKNS
tara:strand:- start:2032 stop:2478 length:447 start_codon:yes stop_codon:yes gene_type:complete